MEDRYMQQGSTAMPMSQANTMPGAGMPIAPSNNAQTTNPTYRAKTPGAAVAPMAAGVPNSVSMPKPPVMPRSENMPNAAIPAAAILQKTPDKKENTPNMPNIPDSEGCNYKKGELPACAPLAAGYVPYQQKNSPKYGTEDALTRGTLFPGLDLPFMNLVNKNNPYAGTPLGELMAIDFACHELTLYLDTHKEDTEAFEMLKTLLALDKEGRKKYEKLYGPIDVKDVEKADRFTWLKDPWPWEYAERGKS